MQWLELGDLAALTKDADLLSLVHAGHARGHGPQRRASSPWTTRSGRTTARCTPFCTAAHYSFPQGPLFSLYGLPEPAGGPAGQPVQLNPQQRGGIFTQAAFLADHAHPNQPSPVQRGKVIRRDVLCDVLPNPPPNVNTQPPDPSPNATTRQRFAVHESDPSCGGCHKLMDPIGFGFENYDGVGTFLTKKEAGQPVDATGEIYSEEPAIADQSFNGAIDLGEKLSQDPQVQSCFVTQWYRFTFGHLESADDACALQGLSQGFVASNLDIRQLLVQIATSDAFRLQKVVP